MPDSGSQQTLRVLEEAYRQAVAWIEHRSQGPVAPAAIAVPAGGLPEHGHAPEDAIAAFLDFAEPGIARSAGPSYFGFVTGGVVPAALAGDWMTSVIDQNGAMSVISPASGATEELVMRWMVDLLALPPTWGGVITSGATMSNFLALASGRQHVGQKLGFNPTEDGLSGNPPIRVVTSTEVHSSTVKALGALGLGRSTVTRLPSVGGSLDVQALETWLREHPEPCIIISNASEVNTGQFDDLVGIARLRNELSPDSWIHVDGAFGAFARVSPQSRHLLDGIEHADSLTSDGHKWLNVPYDAGFVFYRDPEQGKAPFALAAAYLTRTGGFDADTMSMEISRRFRALPAFCALHSLGRDGYIRVVEQCLANARLLMELIEADSGVELVNREAQLANPFCITAFRIVHPDWSNEQTEDANRRLASVVNEIGSSYISGTVWNGQAAVRAAFVNWQTQEEHVRRLFADVLTAREHILAEG